MYVLRFINGEMGFFVSYREAKQEARKLGIKKFIIVKS